VLQLDEAPVFAKGGPVRRHRLPVDAASGVDTAALLDGGQGRATRHASSDQEAAHGVPDLVGNTRKKRLTWETPSTSSRKASARRQIDVKSDGDRSVQCTIICTQKVSSTFAMTLTFENCSAGGQYG